MMSIPNFDLQMKKKMEDLPEGQPLLLHVCCAPCSSAVLERLASFFRVTLFYYNPNIWPQQEYAHRLLEIKRLLQKLPVKYPVTLAEGSYEPERFEQAINGLEAEPEGGARCQACFALRLRKAAGWAAQQGISLFTTTLTVSPHKNAALLNKIGQQAAQEADIQFLPSDFKKKDGYKRSIELSRAYALYRQSYCGCRYSAGKE